MSVVAHDETVDGRLGRAIFALGAYAGCLGLLGVLTLVHGRAHSILIVPLAIGFFWCFCVLIGSVMGIIFGEEPEDWTRSGMLAAAISAALFDAVLWELESMIDVRAVAAAIGLVASGAAWIVIGALFGAISGRLPEMEMAEGD